MISNFYCAGELSLFGLFDLSYAPTLLFYSYIPIIVVSLFLSLFVLLKDRFTLQSKLLFFIALSFSIWSINQIGQWVTVPVNLNHFLWETISIVEILIPIFSIYFVSVFLNKKDLDIKYKLLLGLLFLPVIVALPTTLNMVSFDVAECQANNGSIWYYIYIFEISSIVVMMYMFYNKFRSLVKGDPFRKQIVILALGMFLFLGMFTATNILGDSTLVYEFNLIGPIGMVVFVALLAFMIVKFKTFNIKLIATQALVWVLVILIGSQFFFIKTPINFILSSL